jgi:hypothetical protein
MAAKRIERVLAAWQFGSRKFERVDGAGESGKRTAAKPGIQEAEIERRIMCHELRIANKIEKAGRAILERGGLPEKGLG